MSEIKIGALCLVIAGANKGRSVIVVNHDISDDAYPWLCRATNGKMHDQSRIPWECLWFKGQQLMPIDGINDELKTFEREDV